MTQVLPLQPPVLSTLIRRARPGKPEPLRTAPNFPLRQAGRPPRRRAGQEELLAFLAAVLRPQRARGWRRSPAQRTGSGVLPGRAASGSGALSGRPWPKPPYVVHAALPASTAAARRTGTGSAASRP